MVVYRLNHGCSPLKGRSFCPECKKKIGMIDNIPLLSFILLKGRCRFCQKPISPYYPLTELVTGLAFLLSRYIFLDFALVYRLFIVVVFIILFFSDLRFGTLPDWISLPAIILTGGLYFFGKFGQINDPWLAALGALLFFLLLVFITRGKGMGIGDLKLVFLIGLVLGFPKTVIALWLAFLTGALTGVILVLAKKKTLKQTVPFGPFLIASTIIADVWGERLWYLYLSWIVR